MYRYKNIECRQMTEQDIQKTAALFSENYGVWSETSRINPGKQIRYSPLMIKNNFVDKPDRFIAMVFDDDKLIGHAFYMRRTVQKSKTITWILQLVVDEKYRGNKIGTKLLHSIFGLSDSYACGLFTANPMTIKALEDATFRHVEISKINKNIDVIQSAAFDIFDDSGWINSYNNGIVNTSFYVDHSLLSTNIKKKYENGSFPFDDYLPEGCEWLAFTFKSQKPLIDNQQQLKILTDYSDEMVKEVYSHMRMDRHSWARHTENEVSFIKKHICPNSRILDIGCGQGRHAVLLAKNNYDVVGIDFSEDNIKKAIDCNNSSAKFIVADAREYAEKNKFDVCIALYDVIGSFPKEKENIKLIRNAYRNLKSEGLFILSVMNMELTWNRCDRAKKTVDDIDSNINELLQLASSRTMQNNGDVFDGKKIIIDKKTGICYRKEQFVSDDFLPVEYIVRDRRYTRRGIINMLHREGFSVEDAYCFNARDISQRLNSDNKRAKEILIIARKKNRLYKAFQKMFCNNTFWK